MPTKPSNVVSINVKRYACPCGWKPPLDPVVNLSIALAQQAKLDFRCPDCNRGLSIPIAGKAAP